MILFIRLFLQLDSVLLFSNEKSIGDSFIHRLRRLALGLVSAHVEHLANQEPDKELSAECQN
jgi:hypothetical protein